LYGTRSFELHQVSELAACAALGLAAGLLGIGFMRLLHAAEGVFQRLGPPTLRGAIGGAIVGAIAIGVPAVAGNGFEAIGNLLDIGETVGVVALVLVAKAVATAASVGSGVPGGVFTPSLFLGASLGRLLALGLVACGAHVEPGAFAVVGMAAMCEATTHAPLMASVMLLELTNESTLSVPLLLATIATMTARALNRESLYTVELERRGVPWPPRVIDLENG
jgi:CIC family chloride channel protein